MLIATTPSNTRRKASLSEAFAPSTTEHRMIGDIVLDPSLQNHL
jgi:hypothetical protein